MKYITNDIIFETRITIFSCYFKYRVFETNPNLNTCKSVLRTVSLSGFYEFEYFFFKNMKKLVQG